MLSQQLSLEFHYLRSIRDETSQHDCRHFTGAFFTEDLTARSVGIQIPIKNCKFATTKCGGKPLDRDASHKTCSCSKCGYQRTNALLNSKLCRFAVVTHMPSHCFWKTS